MKKIKFVTTLQALELHELALEFGGTTGIRDTKLLDSAIEQPQATFGGHYLYQDIFEMAAAYAFHIIKNHAFLDANKRTGLLTSLLFLKFNGYKINANFNELYDFMVEVAASQKTKEDIAEFFKKTQSK